MTRIEISVPVTGKPECFDWLGRKVIVIPETVTLYFAPGRPDPVAAEVTGPWKPGRPGILHDGSARMTVAYYDNHPEHWPTWIRELAKKYQPPTD
ncbi:hypothetical protein ACWF94_40385 [Streptomyces sp. NPDC055078]